MNAKPVFIDTNILFYGHDKDAGEKHEKALQAILLAWTGGVRSSRKSFPGKFFAPLAVDPLYLRRPFRGKVARIIFGGVDVDKRPALGIDFPNFRFVGKDDVGKMIERPDPLFGKYLPDVVRTPGGIDGTERLDLVLPYRHCAVPPRTWGSITGRGGGQLEEVFRDSGQEKRRVRGCDKSEVSCSVVEARQEGAEDTGVGFRVLHDPAPGVHCRIEFRPVDDEKYFVEQRGKNIDFVLDKGLALDRQHPFLSAVYAQPLAAGENYCGGHS